MGLESTRSLTLALTLALTLRLRLSLKLPLSLHNDTSLCVDCALEMDGSGMQGV